MAEQPASSERCAKFCRNLLCSQSDGIRPPHRRAILGVHFLHPGARGDTINSLRGKCALCRALVCIGVVDVLATGRVEQDRIIQFSPEKLEGGVDVGNVDHGAPAKPHTVKRGAIGAHRNLFFDACRDVVVTPFRELRLGDRFKLEDVGWTHHAVGIFRGIDDSRRASRLRLEQYRVGKSPEYISTSALITARNSTPHGLNSLLRKDKY